MLANMLRYCALQTVWSVCMLFVSGLDLAIVGHYSFGETGYYAVASSPATLLLMVIAAVMGPLLPAASALSVHRSPEQMGQILVKCTRHSMTILLLTGIPILVMGFPGLRLWVGPDYALRSIQLLRILLLANIVRNACGVYATMVVATAQQRVATAATITEAVVNLVVSLVLVRQIGALGVAMGTLLGAFAGVAVHFAVSMRYTRARIAVSRTRLLFEGILRPSSMAIPSVLLLSRWLTADAHSMTLGLYLLWSLSTVVLVWYVNLDRHERTYVLRFLRERLSVAMKFERA